MIRRSQCQAIPLFGLLPWMTTIIISLPSNSCACLQELNTRLKLRSQQLQLADNSDFPELPRNPPWLSSYNDVLTARMGQGFSLTTLSAGSAGIDVPELSDLIYEGTLGTARFMKSIRARHQDGVVMVKVVVKPYSMSLEKYRKIIIRRCSSKYEANQKLTASKMSEMPWQISQMRLATNESSNPIPTAISCANMFTAPSTIVWVHDHSWKI